ncbi:MAG: hypothetical protein GYB36_05650 [Alphaproteobacteria bacterium]|nr:hypothetical protein [Alphaproteobacteria bacterium]
MTTYLPTTARFAVIALVFAGTAAPAANAMQSADRMEQFAVSADANGDGYITEAEIREARTSRFDRFDRDSNDQLNSDDAPRFLMRQQFNDWLTVMTPDFDTDGNGSISRNEFVNGPMHAFEAADTDQDGQVAVEDLIATAQSLR